MIFLLTIAELQIIFTSTLKRITSSSAKRCPIANQKIHFTIILNYTMLYDKLFATKIRPFSRKRLSQIIPRINPLATGDDYRTPFLISKVTRGRNFLLIFLLKPDKKCENKCYATFKASRCERIWHLHAIKIIDQLTTS